MRKKLLLLATLSILTFTITACGGSEDNKKDTENATKESVSVEDGTQEDEVSSSEEPETEEVKSITVEELMNYPETPEEEFNISVDDDGTVNIWGYKGTDSVIVVPKEIKGSTNIKIEHLSCEHDLIAFRIPGNVEIAYSDGGAFSFGAYELVVIEEGVKELKDYCFMMSDLKTIILPDSIETIGATAFAGTNLTEIKLPASLTELSQYLFQDMNSDSLVIELGDNITEIDSGAFDDNVGKTFILKVKEGTTTYNTVSAFIEENKDDDDLPVFVIEAK